MPWSNWWIHSPATFVDGSQYKPANLKYAEITPLHLRRLLVIHLKESAIESFLVLVDRPLIRGFG